MSSQCRQREPLPMDGLERETGLEPATACLEVLSCVLSATPVYLWKAPENRVYKPSIDRFHEIHYHLASSIFGTQWEARKH